MDSVIPNPLDGELLAAFTSEFGEPDDFWIYRTGGWRRAVTPSANRAETGLEKRHLIPSAKLPARPEELELPIAVHVTDNVILLGTRFSIATAGFGVDMEETIVWATIRTRPAAVLEKLARQSKSMRRMQHELTDLQSGLLPHLEQISADFEELVWLREVCGQMAECDATESLASVAQHVLPKLGTMIKAEALVVLHSETDDVALAPSNETQDSSLWIGPQLANQDVILDLVRQLSAASSSDGLVVRNDLATTSVVWRHAGLRSCILCPIRHGTSVYGHLVALNRIPWRQRSSDPAESVPATASDDEFGTGDATLIASAAGALGAHARNVELLRQKELMLIGTIRTLVNALDAKDSYTSGHSERVASIAKEIAEQLGLSSQACEQVYVAGLLHDIGKIGVPDHVLQKPDHLTDQEYAIIQQHPVVGYNILNHVPSFEQVLPGVLHHHETFDGRGYPHRLKGEAIPLDARILAVADAYDAMTSARPYRAGMPVEKAEAILSRGAGAQWDAAVVNAFFTARARFQQCFDSLSQLHQSNSETAGPPGRTWHDVETEAARRTALVEAS